eukprot:CAMPEP_0198243770 /NCGR_PEP_ID=MMETSP1446-20131203/30622_1 /TAXON_ID=1461542 ORGANISM="Unidentified sp, Strain CCMP2111" /NCGR_SAMPLE_ID=MMETSP1446 /ASSEMBLY_ACC=CAM_ASM_001112 /LENGTH=279 /DNA_ID=CAMNT_0043927689 /DNA_START=60 /DNA_END=900 /DNA_ORIENTATION=+
MAEHLANIFGTEKDRVNCPFYFKIGACRHGDRCSRTHNKPSISQTVLLVNMYQNPALNVAPGQQPPSEREVQDHYEDFYEDVFEELAKHGEIKALNICDNLADHLIGNVYAHFRDENDAASALNALNGRYYAGRVIHAEFSPVTDFREATCRQYEEQTCNRGGYCNFMHLKQSGGLSQRNSTEDTEGGHGAPTGAGVTAAAAAALTEVAGGPTVITTGTATTAEATTGTDMIGVRGTATIGVQMTTKSGGPKSPCGTRKGKRQQQLLLNQQQQPPRQMD